MGLGSSESTGDLSPAMSREFQHRKTHLSNLHCLFGLLRYLAKFQPKMASMSASLPSSHDRSSPRTTLQTDPDLVRKG
jgi:hypothetical protein